MSFVDGENFTIRGQTFCTDNGIALEDGRYWKRDVYLWLPPLRGLETDLNEALKLAADNFTDLSQWFTERWADEATRK